jgi:hypothetical protein
VLGDFNRRFNIAEDEMWRELDDGDPDLTKQTEGLTSVRHSQERERVTHRKRRARGARRTLKRIVRGGVLAIARPALKRSAL